MADNVAVTAGSGTNIAADDISSVFYQRVKLSLGADGSAVDAVAGAGAVSTGVQRVTLASDDPAVASLAVLDNVVLAEDAAHSSGAAGIMPLAVRNDTLAALAGSDGDYAPIQVNASGAVFVEAALGATDNAVLDAINTATTAVAKAVEGDYETVAASQTAQALGGSGATGDHLASLLIVPATTSPGNVIILDDSTSITVFTGGADSVADLKPIKIDLGMYSVSGAWSVTTGANVSVVAVGSFSA